LFRHEVLRLAPGKMPRVLVRDRAAAADARAARPADRGVELESDAVVACAGHQANRLLRPLGCALPIVAVHGYSVTAPLCAGNALAVQGPRGAVMDEQYKVAISHLGQRIRVAGSAELGGNAGAMNAAALATLYKVLDDWFPGAPQLSKATAWKGAGRCCPTAHRCWGQAAPPASG
jgi:D-amino-acid dehydrogenase